MYRPYFALAALLAASLFGCSSGSNPNLPATSQDSPSPVPQVDLSTAIGPSVSHASGLAEGVIGVASLEVDPTDLSATLAMPRDLQTQGDLYFLSVRPFFKPGDLSVTKVRRGAGGTVIVSVLFKHPFKAPADLNPPASATKRIDLHVFDVTALVVTEGTEDFFAGPDQVTTNTAILANPDAYRDPGETFDATAFGIATANVFPYRLVAKNIDTVNPLGNYVPTANGWTGNPLLDPFGYDIFPQGAEVEVDFELNAGTTPFRFDLVTLAKYMDPRSTPQPKTKRLPVAGDPTALQYILPEAAGDVQRITAAATDPLTGGSSSEIIGVDVTVLDWDHGATVATTFPNNADLGEISEPSDIGTIDLSVPQIRASGEFVSGPLAGINPEFSASIAANNVDAFDPLAETQVTGLVRVTDQQDADDATDPSKPLVLGEETPAPIPGATLSSTRYQAVSITVEPGIIDPSCPTYNANSPALDGIVSVPFNFDLDAAATTASHPDGISGYRIDYDNNGSWEATSAGPGGSPAGDFSAPFTYTTTGNKTIQIEVTANAPSSTITICPFDISITPPPPSCPVYNPGSPALCTPVNTPFNLDLDAVITAATHADGIALYKIDYTNDGSWDATSTGPGGSPAGDFTSSHTYTAGTSQMIMLEVTSNAPSSLSSTCPFTVCITHQTLDALTSPPTINPSQVNSSSTSNIESFPHMLLDLPGTDVLWYHRISSGAAPAGHYWYYSTTSGTTWSASPIGYVTTFAGAALTAPTSADMALLANGLPAMAIADSAGNDLGFVSALSLSSGFIDWGQGVVGGPTTRGIEIAGSPTSPLSTAGTYFHVNLVPHPTDQNTVFIIALNTAATGLHPDGLGLYKSVNATIPSPSFTFVGAIDTEPAEEDNPVSVMDSSGKIHILFEGTHPNPPAHSDPGDYIGYRVFDTVANAFTGPVEDVSSTAAYPNATTDINVPYLILNASNEPIAMWTESFFPGTFAPDIEVVASKRVGSSWTTPVQISDLCGNSSFNWQDGPVASIDAVGRIHFAWLDERQRDNLALPYLSIWDGNLTNRLTGDLLLFPEGANNDTDFTNDDYTDVRIVRDTAANKMVLVGSTSFAAEPMSADGMHWYRTYTPMP